MKKHTYYMPLTAAPFKRSEKYRELLPQKAELTGYIRCFWGSGQPYVQTGETADSTLVIPDTCVDIIYYIDDTANTVTGGFAGLMTQAFGIMTMRMTGIVFPFLRYAFLHGVSIVFRRIP